MNVVPSHSRRDIYREITQSIIRAIEQGAGEFVMPWNNDGTVRRPQNACTGSLYRGMNVLALWVTATSRQYTTGFWASYRQWQELDAQVRRSERGAPIVFYQKLDRGEDEHDEEHSPQMVLRTSFVFNGDQVDGWKAPHAADVDMVDRVAAADTLVAATGAVIRHDAAGACYLPVLDCIDMPKKSRFLRRSSSSATEAYYSTLFHELTHWTGHEKRLNRDLRGRFGSRAYAAEELVAELGAAFLCADTGIANSPRQDHAAYVADWLALFSDDPRALMTASAKASAAVEFIAAFRTA
ncbi:MULTISPECIES: zincin-like metallopeptidase domain-containing protein [unclassified Mesorhizobium]|uniref:ArdC family protein n=1 Tax=unclassified Mesorhizobium TaxID=325217 RepID=UPI0003CDDD41|nr:MULTISPECIES: zincin-like metallopeptidase domain-containing protein [unclassified Mesorhizobium]ESY51889.1 peptidase [Mesorhizobium sp. LNJC374B00]ESY55922.1 peptidase [Mesorhizobium sp. LNJC372A00]WJI81263.1 zincin-like metallopeptidase domain-containing protein [Mesorhizobium sp. C374B]WJI87782.1 zincin-like metallopeptidase domain-containing protein [Mesorhizobium sp. C372A]